MGKVVYFLVALIVLVILAIISVLFFSFKPESNVKGEDNLTIISDNSSIIRLSSQQMQSLDSKRDSISGYIDSDGGPNPYVRGSGPGDEIGQAQDYCLSSTDLLENSQTRNGWQSNRVECAIGCQDGACIDHRDINKCVKLRSGTFIGKKINLIFAGLNFDNLEHFRDAVSFELALNRPYIGFFSVEPMRSNLEYFDVYYINDLATSVDPQTETGEYGNYLLDNCADLKKDEYYYPIVLVYGYFDGGGTASFSIPHISTVGFNDPINISSENSRANVCQNKKMNIDQDSEECTQYIQEHIIIGAYFELHEFGHSFGNLLDEYSSSDAEGINLPAGINQVNANCFTEGEGTTQQSCLSKANWRDLIGNGCGQDLIIDCNEGNPDYIFEVGCFEGCMKIPYDSFRSTRANLMGHGIPPSQIVPRHIFGLPNERQICCQILTKTGSVTGFCNEFNKKSNLIPYCMENTQGLTHSLFG